MVEHSTQRLPALVCVLALFAAACGGSGDDGGGADGGNNDGAGADGASTDGASADGGVFEIDEGGMTLTADPGVWERQVDEFADEGTERSYFVSQGTGAVVEVQHRVGDSVDITLCDAGEDDPLVQVHSLTLLADETLGNGGTIRIPEEDLDPFGSDRQIGISYVYFKESVEDDRAVGDTYCESKIDLASSQRTRDDGELVNYQVKGFFPASLGVPGAPFKETFDSLEALQSRDGYDEMVDLLASIEVPE